MKKIVTSYHEPDLDGVSSMYAYSEHLNQKGIESDYYISGKAKQEVDIVCELFDIKLEPTDTIYPSQEIIVVDTNNLEEVPFVNPQNIIEFIDHHSKNKTSEICVNAKMQIERIGAVATLIAERIKNSGIKISREAAILLYYGIISNSINLKASITSKKDIEMAEWLKKECKEITEEKIAIIFKEKSKIKDENLRYEMEAETTFDYKGKSMTIAQLEVANLKEFLNEKKDNIIKILNEVKQEKSLDYIFINCIDILNGFNIIITIDDDTKKILEETFGYKFIGKSCEIGRVIQRKELSKVLKEQNLK